MLKLIKHLKNHIAPILLIISLLVVQAICDLSLPDYTSKIVNIGIQQGGVENAAPTAIRKSEMDKLLLFMNNEDKEYVINNYKLIDKDEAHNNYPKVKSEEVYELVTDDEDVVNTLSSKFSRPMLIVSSMDSKEESQKIKEEMNKSLPPEMAIPKEANLIDIFKSMPDEKMNEVRSEMNEKFKTMPEGIEEQAAISYVKGEYESIGIDTSSMQNRYILKSGGIMILIALLSMVATVIVGYIGAKVAASLGRDLRGKVFTKVVGFSNNELDKFSTASLITRSTNDIQQIQILMVMLLRIVFYAPILGIGGVIKVLNTNTSMAWIIGVAVVSILSLVIVLFGISAPKFKSLQKLVDKVNLVTRETLTGMLVIRAFGTEKHEEERFDNANKDLTRTNLFVNRTMSLMMPMMLLIMNAIAILIVWSGAHSVDNGSMQVGDMMAFIQYTMQIIMSFLMISMVSIMLPRATVAAGRIDEVLNTPFSIKDPEAPKAFNENMKGVIEFKNVSFRYQDAKEDVLKDISFIARPGETTAFIGSTGSGKSTLVNLIPRFFDVTEGEILISGVNVKDIGQKDLRDKIGYVPQKGVLFSGTIDSNIRYGRKESSEEEIKKAADMAAATEFITTKGEGFEAEISQGGSNVSGGQKQRLSIARAIAKNPDIYIFDDSFSALDFKTDAKVRKSIKEGTSNSTVLIVAQRISTIMNSEQIIVIDEGRVVGKGNHKELLETCDVYREIAKSQFSKEELSNE